ncbi:endonuclease-reverse transcriptase [Elysia marginata]|uniref:Endonuclease-reverse transcriptase n=1 Tax=Elysia marginata TaxID=1093978 RepID=A0AAV4FUE0_9GAST|nr:endonuclease-reverse transcriptase [Elysia marginata]
MLPRIGSSSFDTDNLRLYCIFSLLFKLSPSSQSLWNCLPPTSKTWGTISSKSFEKNTRQKRWSEYISELFDDDRNEDLTLQGIAEGPEIMREEENTIKNIKTGKATGPDMISTEMMQALEGIELDAITKMLNTIYDTGEIPKNATVNFHYLTKETRSDRV